MKEALYYTNYKGKVKCFLCPNNCVISKSRYGKCKTRKNVKGKLIPTTYGKPCSISIDPIEKKPLFHFLPGEKVFSLSTTGCNLHCKFCQNWEISQARLEEVPFKELSPEEVIKKCKSKIIAYTYTEPTVYYEYVLDCAKLAKKKRIKNVTVTNGYINIKPLRRLYKYIDAANVDLKSFDNSFYKKYCGAQLEPVLESIKEIHKKSWLEVTNLIIPGYNDDREKIKEMCEWLKELDSSIPLHFSRYFPCYKLKAKPTPEKTLLDAYNIAKEVGLKYVYLGNMVLNNDTLCPDCGKVLIKRYNNLLVSEKKKCKCGYCLEGRFIN